MATAKDNKDLIKQGVKGFYTKKLHVDSKNIQNSVVSSQYCAARKVPGNIQEALKLCHDEVVSKYYGCGLVFPECIEGRHILDLGCGTGRDCFILSKLIGAEGHVTGVDLIQGPLDIANKYTAYHAKQFGYSQANTVFLLGDAEDLRQAGIQDNSVEVIVSNCVVNLTVDKKAVLREAQRVLKTGGEMYFSDMYSDRMIPDDLKANEIMWGEGLAGALFWRSLVDLCRETGLSGPYLVNANKMTIMKQEFRDLVGDTQYISATYRIFKARQDDDDKMYNVTYQGSIKGHADNFKFDVHTIFKTDVVVRMRGAVAEVLRQSRFAKHFIIDPSPLEPTQEEQEHDVYALADPVAIVTGKCCSTN